MLSKLPKQSVKLLRSKSHSGLVKAYTTAVNIKAQPEDNAPVSARDWQEAKPLKSVPGLSKFQWVRGFLKGGEFEGISLNDVLLKCRQNYGDTFTIPGVFGQGPSLSLFNVDHFAQVFRTEGTYPVRPGNEPFTHYRKQRQDGFFEVWEGLISNGKQWAQFRHAVNPILMQPRNVKLYLEPIQEVSDDFIERLSAIRDPDSLEMPDNFEREINHLTFESVAVVALDTRLGLLEQQANRERTQFLFDNIHIILTSIMELGIKPSLYKYIKTPTYRRFEKSNDMIFDITSQYINEALERIEKKGKDAEAKSVLEKLLQVNPKIGQVMAMDMLLAGVDTTTAVLCATIMCIATNPEKQQKLREEVLSVVPHKSDKFSVDNMKDMPYLRACLKESLRLYPLTFGNMREAGRDIIIDGYRVPKGTRIFMNSNLLLREEKYFPRPNEFLPERWLRAAKAENAHLTAENLNPFIYLPFGFGPRFCIGKRLVDLMVEMTLSNLVRNFKVEFNYPTENAFKYNAMLKVAVPLKFKLTNLN